MNNQIAWLAAPPDLPLPEGEVHLWKAYLDLTAGTVAQLSECLNDAEQDRAKRFVFDKDRIRFTAARSILRLLVARYLNGPAKAVEFIYGPQGKPALGGDSHLCFNLAHSDGLALYAFSFARELGVDVESQRRFTNRENEEIVQSHFSAKEQAEFRSLDPKLRDTAFYLGWTRKEAYLKARGEGLQIPLQSFDVSLTPGESVVLRSDDATRWELHSFCPEPAFVAALVAEGANSTLRFWEWPRYLGTT